MQPSLLCGHGAPCLTSQLHACMLATGVATYVADAFSPLDARADCLGEGECDIDIDREGRCATQLLVAWCSAPRFEQHVSGLLQQSLRAPLQVWTFKVLILEIQLSGHDCPASLKLVRLGAQAT